MGFSFVGEDDVVIGHLRAIEIRDKFADRRENSSMMENSLSDDEAN